MEIDKKSQNFLQKIRAKDLVVTVIAIGIFYVCNSVEPKSDSLYLRIGLYVMVLFDVIKFASIIYLIHYFASSYFGFSKKSKVKKRLSYLAALLLILGSVRSDFSNANFEAMQNTLKPIRNLAAIAEHCGVSQSVLDNMYYQAELNFIQSPVGKSWFPDNSMDQDETEALQATASSAIYSSNLEFEASQMYSEVDGNNYIQHINAYVQQPTPSDDAFSASYKGAFFSCQAALATLRLAGYDLGS